MRIHPDFSYNGIAANEIIQWKRGDFADWEQPIWQFMHDWLTEGDTIQVQTSGSSGQPTVWQVKKSAMETSAEMTANYFKRFNRTTALLTLPSVYIAGKMMMVRAMTQGWTLTAIAPSVNPLMAVNQAFDFAAFTPMQLATLSEEQWAVLAKFGTVIVGGAAIPESLRTRLAERCNNVFETYGMAETLSHIAVRKVSPQNTPFETLKGISLTVDSEQRLQILAPYISPEFIQTQDVVQLLNPTSFFYQGRFDRMINSGGVKLFAEVIEKKLEGIMNQPFHISSLPDEVLGRRLVLYIESETELDEGKLKAQIAPVLERYEVPKEIIAVKSFERTSSGKIKQIRN